MQRPAPLFDSHCHLQDPRLALALPQLLRESASLAGVKWFAVNGTSEDDWEAVKSLGESHPEIIPCFGLHPWYVEGRSANWFGKLRALFKTVPYAAVGEAGLDKGGRGKQVTFSTQVDVCKQQLSLAKELERPVAVHCVRAFGDLHDIVREIGPFPAGIIFHSYLGSGEMVHQLAKYGAYFSFSGFLMSMSSKKAKKMLQEVPLDRILLETDAPDALPYQADFSSLKWVPGDIKAPNMRTNEAEEGVHVADNEQVDTLGKASSQALNHPANIKIVLDYVAAVLGITENELASMAYGNALRLFSYSGSKVLA